MLEAPPHVIRLNHRAFELRSLWNQDLSVHDDRSDRDRVYRGTFVRRARGKLLGQTHTEPLSGRNALDGVQIADRHCIGRAQPRQIERLSIGTSSGP